MAGSAKTERTRAVSGARSVLRVLEKKPYYAHRFLGQVQALYGTDASGAVPELPAVLYLDSIFAKIPPEVSVKVGSLASTQIVNSLEGCPSPHELRGVIAEAILGAMDLSHVKLLERAKVFLTNPPTEQAIADRWLERVIYTTLRRIGRDRFINVPNEDWANEVAESMFGDSEALLTYRVAQREPIESSKRDFTLLVSRHA